VKSQIVRLLLSTFVLSAGLVGYAVPAFAADVTTGLVAYWNFENGTTLGNSRFGGFKLTNNGSPAYSATGGYASSKGLLLNGSSYLETNTYPASLNGNNPYTIAAWFNTTQANNGGILGYGSTGTCLGNNLRLNGGTSFHAYWYACDLTSSSVANFVGTWHHVAVTYDGTTRAYYYDGAFLNSATGATRATTGNLFYLGKTVNDVAFAGTLDEVALYTRALTLADVQALKGGALNVADVSTVALTVSGNVKTILARQALTLTAATSVAGKVTFLANGKPIPACNGIVTVSLVATCTWRPSVKALVRLSAGLLPTDVAISTPSTSTDYWISVGSRTGTR